MNTEQEVLRFECRECKRKSGQLRDIDGGIICLNCKSIDFGTIHGHQVLEAHPTPAGGGTRAGRVILVDRGPSHNGGSRWITAWHGRDNLGPNTGWDSEWGWGHYFDDEALARADYHMRCVRGY